MPQVMLNNEKEDKIDSLCRELSLKAQRNLFEIDENLFVNIDYLQSYFDEAIHNAIETQCND